MKVEVGPNQSFDFDSLERYLQKNWTSIQGFQSNSKINSITQCGRFLFFIFKIKTVDKAIQRTLLKQIQ
jgi:hypothetical protein